MKSGKLWRGNLLTYWGYLMTSHSGPHIFFLDHIVLLTNSHHFQPQRCWKWTLVAPGNKVLGLWIICSIFILLVTCLLEASVDCYKCAGQPRKAWDRPSVCCHGKKKSQMRLFNFNLKGMFSTVLLEKEVFSFDCSLNPVCFMSMIRFHGWRIVFILEA